MEEAGTGGLQRLAKDAIAGVTTDAGRLDVHRRFRAIPVEERGVDERQPGHPDLQENGEPAEPVPETTRGVHQKPAAAARLGGPSTGIRNQKVLPFP